MDNGLSPRDEVLFGGGTPVLILIVMDNGLSRVVAAVFDGSNRVLILIVMDNGLSLILVTKSMTRALKVLILIVMDNGLSQRQCHWRVGHVRCLNPYCNG